MFRSRWYGTPICIAAVVFLVFAFAGCSGDSGTAVSGSDGPDSEATKDDPLVERAQSWSSLSESEQLSVIEQVLARHGEQLKGITDVTMRSAVAGGPGPDAANTSLERWMVAKACERARALYGEKGYGKAEDPYCGSTGFQTEDTPQTADAGGDAKSEEPRFSYKKALEDPSDEWVVYLRSQKSTVARRYLRAHRSKYPDVTTNGLIRYMNSYGVSENLDSVGEALAFSARKNQRKKTREKRDDAFVAAYKRLIDNEGAVGMTIDQVVAELGPYSDKQRVGGIYFYYYAMNQLVVENGVVTQVNIY